MHTKKRKNNNGSKNSKFKNRTEATERSEGELLNVPSFALGKDSLVDTPSGITSTY